MELKGKSIIITGASSGIGAAAAEIFAAAGAQLVLAARRETQLALVANRIRDRGGKVEFLVGDVCKANFHKALVDLAVGEFGGLDGAFNNAGTTGDLGPLTEMTAENWQHVITTNLDACFHASRAQIPAMQKRGGGSIVFTGSFVGHTIGMPGMTAYAASKAGIIGLTQSLAVEYGAGNIRVNALLPGGTNTEMAGNDEDFLKFVINMHALKRIAEPEEIARAAAFLLSDDASFITGSAMLADGGNSICKT